MSFLTFTEEPNSERKTKRWCVISTNGSIKLGHIMWYTSWRRYCFYPFQDTVFDTVCLKEVVAFIEEKMAEHSDELLIKKYGESK